MTKLYTYLCAACDGDNLIYEIPTRWNVKKQAWVPTGSAGTSNSWCDDCGDYHDIKRVEWHPVLPEEVTK